MFTIFKKEKYKKIHIEECEKLHSNNYQYAKEEKTHVICFPFHRKINAIFDEHCSKQLLSGTVQCILPQDLGTSVYYCSSPTS